MSDIIDGEIVLPLWKRPIRWARDWAARLWSRTFVRTYLSVFTVLLIGWIGMRSLPQQGAGEFVREVLHWLYLISLIATLLILLVTLFFFYPQVKKLVDQGIQGFGKNNAKVDVKEGGKEQTKKEEKKEKYEFYNFGLLISVHWVGVIGTYSIFGYLANLWLEPFIRNGLAGLPYEGLRAWIYLILFIPFLFMWRELLSPRRKGPRPISFALARIFSVLGIAYVVVLIAGWWLRKF